MITGDGRLAVENRFSEETLADLDRRGHRLLRCGPWELSRNQVLSSLPERGWAVASDIRSEGLALGW